MAAPYDEVLVDREAIQESGTARRDQVRLAASLAGMSGIPGHVGAAQTVMMSELRRARPRFALCEIPVARPVLARVIHAVGEGAALRSRTGQDIVLVGRRILHTRWCDARNFL